MKANTLQEIFDVLVENGSLAGSRIPTCKSALRQYASLLEVEMAHCTPNLFNKPTAERNALIERGMTRTKRDRKNGSSTLSESAIRNTKNNITYVFRKAVEAGLLPTSAVELPSWRRARKALSNLYGGIRVPPRGECQFTKKYILDPVPSTLAAEFETYRIWCTSQFNPERPNSLKRRMTTHINAHDGLLRIAGFLVKYRNVAPDSLTLAALCEPNNVKEFLGWFIEARGKSTATSSKASQYAQTLARYFSLSAATPTERQFYEERVRELKELHRRLPRETSAYDKSKRWLSLKQIEAVGKALDPFNPVQINERAPKVRDEINRQLVYLKNEGAPRNTNYNFTRFAGWAGVSLMLRLLVRIPLRQRNLREMAWNPTQPEAGLNLYKRDSRWFLLFVGEQLKVAHKGKEVNTIEHEFPIEIVPDLERWLYLWRPLLTKFERTHSVIKDLRSDGGQSSQEYVFLNAIGNPYTSNLMHVAIKKATFKYAGVAVNPHMIRTIYATEQMRDTHDPQTTAYMLNNKPETMQKFYYELIKVDAAARARSWTAQKFAE
jgi:hypothetical protein